MKQFLLLIIFFSFYFTTINSAEQKFEFLTPFKSLFSSAADSTNNKPLHCAMILYTFFWSKYRLKDYAEKNPFWR